MASSAGLLASVLALSSRHLSVINGYDPITSDFYYQQCLEGLIPALNETDIELGEELLAATVILRCRAEFEGMTK